MLPACPQICTACLRKAILNVAGRRAERAMGGSVKRTTQIGILDVRVFWQAISSRRSRGFRRMAVPHSMADFPTAKIKVGDAVVAVSLVAVIVTPIRRRSRVG